jgi:hypothetical protein
MKLQAVVCCLMIGLLLFLLTGCRGNGGDSAAPQTSSVSGVAAAGAPISGSVTLKDSKGIERGPVAIDTDGNFSLDVQGLTPPFLLKAASSSRGQTAPLFSVATGAGTANINPFTSVILQLATNIEPATFYANPALPSPPITSASLEAATKAAHSSLAPIFTKYGITDFSPLGGRYLATPDNKLDAVLDLISFKVENGDLTICNKMDGSILASGSLADTASIILDLTKLPGPATLIDIKQITQMLGSLRAVLNQGNQLTMASIEPFFIPDPHYGTSNGHTRAEDVASVLAIFGPGGTNPNGALKSIRNVRLVSDQTGKYNSRGVSKVYLLNFDFIHDSGVIVHGNDVTLAKGSSTEQWKYIGDPVGSVIGNNTGVIMTMDTGGLISNVILTTENPIISLDVSFANMTTITSSTREP